MENRTVDIKKEELNKILPVLIMPNESGVEAGNSSAVETPDRWPTTLNTRPDIVFQEVNAIITPGYLRQITQEPEALLTKLHNETGIKVEKIQFSNGDEQFSLHGALDQIVLSKIKLQSMLMDRQLTTPSHSPGSSAKDFTGEDGIQDGKRSTRNKGNPRSRRKVFTPRKLPNNTYGASSTSDDKNRMELEEILQPIVILEEESNNNQQNVEIKSEISMDQDSSSPISLSLEEEAERKANEWLAIPEILSVKSEMLGDVAAERNLNCSIPTRFVYSCELCNFQAEREGQFLKHVLTHSKRDTVHQCKKCAFASVSLSHYNRHQLTHTDATFNCPQCEFTSDDPKMLARHITVKHTLTPNPLKRSSLLQCNDCPYNTTKIYHFERHLLVHNRDLKGLLQVHQCDQCPYKTHRKEHIIRHRHNVHIRHRPYSCDSCHRTYKNLDSLQHHQLTHAPQLGPITT